MTLFDEILKSRGLVGATRDNFLSPNYETWHDPFLLPDMKAAVERLVKARANQERITIYGDYDIDGLTATTLLIEALKAFGFSRVEAFIPNRFVEGYGLTVDAIEKIAASYAQLIITVDCGSLSHAEITRANELGVDVIVTDHHNVAHTPPPAVATINPKRLLYENPDKYINYILRDGSTTSLSAPVVSRRPDSATLSLPAAELADAQTSSLVQDNVAAPAGLNKGPADNAAEPSGELYPFIDLAGVGIAFKLVQALQTKLDGLAKGQEKWLLDLVALGTVCDVVTLADENRANVYWGLKVLSKTRRPGLKALMAVAGVDQAKVNARSLGFALGPRMNAAGRLETARHALDMLLSNDPIIALEKAQQLDDLNYARRSDQAKIVKEAVIQAENYKNDPVLVVSHPSWSHGIIGIVAAKLLEKYQKPTFVLQEMSEKTKGSARSYGDFSAADAIKAAGDLITTGGGHKLAAGVTMPTKNIAAFRARVNEFYASQKLFNQAALLLPKADAVISDFKELTEELLKAFETMEPFGSDNPEPVLKAENILVIGKRQMGGDGQHVKLTLKDDSGKTMQFLAFSAPQHFFVEPGERVTVWFQLSLNEWQGTKSLEGRMLHLEAED